MSFLARWRRVFTVSSGMPRDDAVSLTLSCSTMRITNTTRNGAGRLSIARSSNSRTWLRAAAGLGIEMRHADDLSLNPVELVERVQWNRRVPSMKAIDRLVGDDARQPSRKACVGTEASRDSETRSDTPPAARPRLPCRPGRSPVRPGRAFDCDAERSDAARTRCPPAQRARAPHRRAWTTPAQIWVARPFELERATGKKVPENFLALRLAFRAGAPKARRCVTVWGLVGQSWH